MKVLFALFLLAMSSAVFAQMPPLGPGVSHELAKWRAAHYSDVRYKLNLTLEKMSPVLKGTMEIRVNVRGGGVQTPIILDWRRIRGHEEKSAVTNVTINGKTVVIDATPPADARGIAYQYNEHLIFRR